MPDEVWSNSVIADTILAEKENANATHAAVRSGPDQCPLATDVSADRKERHGREPPAAPVA